jgi:hypothetical protein
VSCSPSASYIPLSSCGCFRSSCWMLICVMIQFTFNLISLSLQNHSHSHYIVLT